MKSAIFKTSILTQIGSCYLDYAYVKHLLKTAATFVEFALPSVQQTSVDLRGACCDPLPRYCHHSLRSSPVIPSANEEPQAVLKEKEENKVCSSP